MPALPPGLNEWLPSGTTIGFGIFLFGMVRADLKASEARQREDLKDGLAKLDDRKREDNKALNEKLARLLESRLPTHPQNHTHLMPLPITLGFLRLARQWAGIDLSPHRYVSPDVFRRTCLELLHLAK